MDLKQLPARPSLEQYKKQAKELVKSRKSGDAETLRRIRQNHPQLRKLSEADFLAGFPNVRFLLADAQLVIASEHGFESWAKFAESIKQPQDVTHSAPPGLSSPSPLYKIDRKLNTIEPRQPLSEKDWDTVFGVMKEQQITGLNAGAMMTDAVLERLPQLNFMTGLNLDGSKLITDDGLLHLAKMPQLRELNLNGWESAITDRGMEVLRHLTELRQFQMCWPQRITDAGAANLKFCHHLERVDLMGTHTGDDAIKALTGKRNLRHFKAGGGVTVDGLSLLHQFPMFKAWQGGETSYAMMDFEARPTYLLFQPTNFAEEGLDRLVGLDGLFALNIDGPVQMTAKGLLPLMQLPNLGWLGVDPTDEAMRHIAAMRQLRMLMCQDTKADDEGFEALSYSQTIEYIWGRKCYGLTGRGFGALAAMPALKGLSVSCKNVDDAGLSALPSFPALRELMPMDVPDDGYRHIGRCAQLESLVLMYCRDTGDTATEHIASLSGLKKYFASYTKITDRSMEILSRMPSLECISFYGCPDVTNAGVVSLAGLPRLRELEISGPQITRECAAAFAAHVSVEIG